MTVSASTLLRHFFEDRTSTEVFLKCYRMTKADLEYFFVELTSLFRDASPQMVDALKAHYTSYPWDEWCPASRLKAADRS